MISELWDKRSLIWSFAITDLKVRYRNSALGFLWTILEPLLMLAVLFVVFTSIFPQRIEHFGMYLLLGIIMWGMLTRGTEIGMNSILARSSLVTQIYFPKEIPAISSAITSALMLIFEFIVFGIFMIVFQFVPPSTIVLLPLVIILEFILVMGLSLPLSVVNVRFRDVQFIWRVVLQAGFFLTPIFYSFEILPENIQNVLQFSPMVQIMNIAHDVAIFGNLPSIESVQLAIILVSIVVGISYGIFRVGQRRIVEEL